MKTPYLECGFHFARARVGPIGVARVRVLLAMLGVLAIAQLTVRAMSSTTLFRRRRRRLRTGRRGVTLRSYRLDRSRFVNNFGSATFLVVRCRRRRRRTRIGVHFVRRPDRRRRCNNCTSGRNRCHRRRRIVAILREMFRRT